MKIKSFIVALAALAVSTIASAQEDPAVLWNKAVQALKAKNYAEAARIRAELLERGVTLVDTSAGTTYKKN